MVENKYIFMHVGILEILSETAQFSCISLSNNDSKMGISCGKISCLFFTKGATYKMISVTLTVWNVHCL